MALQYRKKVRDAILALLNANFNSTAVSVCQVYGVDPVVLDFSAGSANFAVSHIEAASIENCQFTAYPAACLYTTDAVDSGDSKGFQFSGQVMAHLDFYVRNRDGAEGFDTESQFDAIEDTVLTILNARANQWPAGVVFARNSKMERECLIPLGDGFATRIPISTLFEVYIS